MAMLVQVGETTEESNLGTNLGHARGVTNRRSRTRSCNHVLEPALRSWLSSLSARHPLDGEVNSKQ
jgi:hypothetical protein